MVGLGRWRLFVYTCVCCCIAALLFVHRKLSLLTSSCLLCVVFGQYSPDPDLSQVFAGADGKPPG